MTKKEKTNKNTKKKIIVICIAIALVSLMSVLARYVLNRIDDFFARTTEFYFYSDKLGTDHPTYQMESWGGGEPYEILIKMNSNKNSLLSASYDIAYTITVDCSDNVICSPTSDSRIIYSSSNFDSFVIVVSPDSNKPLKTGDMAWIEIVVEANTNALDPNTNSPYEKTLSARFNLVVGQENVTYKITDAPYDPYLELVITNTRNGYIVDTAFGGYNVGDKLTREEYLELNPSSLQQNCSSAKVTIGFDPTILLLDMTNENYLRGSNISTNFVNSYEYINGMTFKVEPITATIVRFYKVDATQDYSYPGATNSPIINVVIP